MRHAWQWRAVLGVLVGALSLNGLAALAAPTPAPSPDNPSAAAGTARNSGEPLVIVFDISGSMNDEDGQGINKLDAAKAAMTDLLRNSNSAVSLWTYPGGLTDESGCSPGGWYGGLHPANNPDPTDVDASIRVLTANGNTPTGPALQQVGEELQKAGHRSATILLVSDGESNCGPPPCEIARQLVSTGFDVRIPTVGFDISAQGREQLECVASVTEAQYVDAADTEALRTEIGRYQAATLELEVKGPTKIVAGRAATLTAVVTNPSNVAVSSGQVSLLLLGQDNRRLVPTILAPRRRLPALAPGESREITWTMSTAPQQTGMVEWRVVASAPTSRAAVSDGAFKVVKSGLAIGDAGKILRQPAGVTVVLGDSFSSGEGIGKYENELHACHRSPQAYGMLLGGQGAQMVACSGATTKEVTASPQHDTPPQLTALNALPQVPGLAYITVGGNDIGFANIVKGCMMGDCVADGQKVTDAFVDAKEAKDMLVDTYLQVLDEINSEDKVSARKGKLAPLIVSPYPDMLWGANRGACMSPVAGTNLGFSARELTFGKQLLGLLNGSARKAVEDLQGRGYPIYFAEDVVDFAQPLHTICDKSPYFVPIAAVDAIFRYADDLTSANAHRLHELAHPNQDGHSAWAEAIVAWSQRVEPQLPVSYPERRSNSGIGALLKKILGWSAPSEVVVRHDLSTPAGAETSEMEITAKAGAKIQLDLSGLAPNSRVVIRVHSRPVTLGSLEADAEGQVQGQVNLPPELLPGEHRLVILGSASDWAFKRVELPLQVGVPVNLTRLLLLGLSLGALLTAGVLQVAARRQGQAAHKR